MMDPKELLYIVRRCDKVKDILGLKRLVAGDIRDLFPHDMAVMGIGAIFRNRVAQVINVDFPNGYISNIIKDARVTNSPLVRNFRSQLTPQFINLDDLNQPVPQDWLKAIRDYRISSVAGHGQPDLYYNSASYFCFGRRHSPMEMQETELLRVLIPHLHATLTKILLGNVAGPVSEHALSSSNNNGDESVEESLGNGESSGNELSQRELEILNWVCVGKTNYEIGVILGISKFTVKNHIQSILGKLSVYNRTQAVNRALSLGLISHSYSGTTA